MQHIDVMYRLNGILTIIATMKMAAANVPTAMYALCNPAVVPLATPLKLVSPKGCAFVVGNSSAFTTVSMMNSSKVVEMISQRKRNKQAKERDQKTLDK